MQRLDSGLSLCPNEKIRIRGAFIWNWNEWWKNTVHFVVVVVLDNWHFLCLHFTKNFFFLPTPTVRLISTCTRIYFNVCKSAQELTRRDRKTSVRHPAPPGDWTLGSSDLNSDSLATELRPPSHTVTFISRTHHCAQSHHYHTAAKRNNPYSTWGPVTEGLLHLKMG